MATRGRKPKPTEQKRRTGNPGKRALPGGGQLAAVPAITPDATERTPEDALAEVLDAGVHWIASTDAPAVALLRDALDHLAELREDPKAEVRDLIALRKQVSDLLSQLGFDPTARARLGLAEVKAQSKLAELEERKSKQHGR